MIDVQLTEGKIPLEILIATDVAPEHGAQVVFAGMVRNHNEGKNVLAVSYQAFAPLALQTFREICEKAQAQWGEDLTLKLWHRTGRVEIGELSVAIIVSSRHRDASYQASRFMIEELKKKAPIWKKEHYADGDSVWLQGTSLTAETIPQ